jgi:hypothetical protein
VSYQNITDYLRNAVIATPSRELNEVTLDEIEYQEEKPEKTEAMARQG